MTRTKREPIRDRMLRAFAAGTSDLKPGGRLPKGLSTEQATRACVAFAAVSLDRFATAGEKMLAVLEDTEPEPEGGWPDEDVEPPRIEHPGLPGIPAGPVNPEQIAKLIEEQDEETCRKFAIVFLSWLEGRTDIANMRETVEDLIRDLRAEEVGAVELVRDCYREALGLDDGDDQADEEQADADKADADRETAEGWTTYECSKGCGTWEQHKTNKSPLRCPECGAPPAQEGGDDGPA